MAFAIFGALAGGLEGVEGGGLGRADDGGLAGVVRRFGLAEDRGGDHRRAFVGTFSGAFAFGEFEDGFFLGRGGGTGEGGACAFLSGAGEDAVFGTGRSEFCAKETGAPLEDFQQKQNQRREHQPNGKRQMTRLARESVPNIRQREASLSAGGAAETGQREAAAVGAVGREFRRIRQANGRKRLHEILAEVHAAQ